MVKATWNGVVIAESNDTVVVEGNHYFPISSLKSEYFKDTTTTSTCPWKGVAKYKSVVVNGQTNTDACWYYPSPKAGAEQVSNRAAFWKGVTVA